MKNNYSSFNNDIIEEFSLVPPSNSNIEKMTNQSDQTPTYNHLIADPNNSIGNWVPINGKWGGQEDYDGFSNENKDLYINYYFSEDSREDGEYNFTHPSRTLNSWSYPTHAIAVDIPQEICEKHQYTYSGFNNPNCKDCNNCKVQGNFLFKNENLARANVKTKSGGPVFGDEEKLPPIIGPGWAKWYSDLYPAETGNGHYFTYRATDLKNDEDKCKEAGYTSCANKEEEEVCIADGYTSCANKEEEEVCIAEGYTSCANKEEEEVCIADGYTSCANKEEEEVCIAEGYTSCANKEEEEFEKLQDACREEGYTSCANKITELACIDLGFSSCSNKKAEEECRYLGFSSCADKETYEAEKACRDEGYTSCEQMKIYNQEYLQEDENEDEQEDEQEEEEEEEEKKEEEDKVKQKISVDKYLESLKIEFILNNYFTSKFEKVRHRFLKKEKNENHYLIIITTDKVEEKLQVKIKDDKASLMSPKNISHTSGYAIILYLVIFIFLILILSLK